jgi:hypothetical protein
MNLRFLFVLLALIFTVEAATNSTKKNTTSSNKTNKTNTTTKPKEKAKPKWI